MRAPRRLAPAAGARLAPACRRWPGGVGAGGASALRMKPSTTRACCRATCAAPRPASPSAADRRIGERRAHADQRHQRVVGVALAHRAPSRPAPAAAASALSKCPVHAHVERSVRRACAPTPRAARARRAGCRARTAARLRPRAPASRPRRARAARRPVVLGPPARRCGAALASARATCSTRGRSSLRVIANCCGAISASTRSVVVQVVPGRNADRAVSRQAAASRARPPGWPPRARRISSPPTYWPAITRFARRRSGVAMYSRSRSCSGSSPEPSRIKRKSATASSSLRTSGASSDSRTRAM